MNKQELIEKTGESIYGVWLRVAEREFDPLDPQSAFEYATLFIKELQKQNPEF